MKKHLRNSVFVFVLISSWITVNAQSFSVTLSNSGSDLRHSRSRMLNDGSVISLIYDQNTLTSHIVKITTDGTTAWAKMYQNIRIDDIQELPSGNLAIAGSHDYYYSTWALLDPSGNQIWAKQLYTTGGSYDLSSVDILRNGKILYSFSQYSSNLTVRCGEDGNEDNCDDGEDTTSHGKNPRFDSFGCEDSGWVSCHKSDDRIMLIRRNSNGDVMWAKDYMKSTTEYFHIKKIKELTDGNLMGVGLVSESYTGPNNSGFIIKMDNTGEVLWTKKYALPSNPGYFSSTFRSFEIEGSFIYVSGYYTTDYQNMNNFMIKMDDNGNVIDSKQMVTSTNLLTMGLTPSMGTVTFEHDMKNHYLIYNNYAAGESGMNVEVNKASFDGPLGCEVVDFPVTVTDYVAITNTQPASYIQTDILATTPGDITPFLLVTATSSIGMNDACATLAGISTESALKLTAYPNPATEALNIAGLSDDRSYIIQIIDLTGKVVQTKTGISGVQLVNIPVEDIHNGSYVLNITDLSTNKTTQLKWMKM